MQHGQGVFSFRCRGAIRRIWSASFSMASFFPVPWASLWKFFCSPGRARFPPPEFCCFCLRSRAFRALPAEGVGAGNAFFSGIMWGKGKRLSMPGTGGAGALQSVTSRNRLSSVLHVPRNGCFSCLYGGVDAVFSAGDTSARNLFSGFGALYGSLFLRGMPHFSRIILSACLTARGRKDISGMRARPCAFLMRARTAD